MTTGESGPGVDPIVTAVLACAAGRDGARKRAAAAIGLTQEANDLFLGVSLLHRSDLRLGLI